MGRISSTATHSTCTTMHIHLSARPFTHTCPHPFPHTCGHSGLGSSHKAVHTGMCLYAHSHVSAHPQTPRHILNPTPVSLHTHVPVRAHPPTHTHPCAHLHTLTLPIPPLGPPAIPFILWLLRITLPAGEEAVLPQPRRCVPQGATPERSRHLF